MHLRGGWHGNAPLGVATHWPNLPENTAGPLVQNDLVVLAEQGSTPAHWRPDTVYAPGCGN